VFQVDHLVGRPLGLGDSDVVMMTERGKRGNLGECFLPKNSRAMAKNQHSNQCGHRNRGWMRYCESTGTHVIYETGVDMNHDPVGITA